MKPFIYLALTLILLTGVCLLGTLVSTPAALSNAPTAESLRPTRPALVQERTPLTSLPAASSLPEPWYMFDTKQGQCILAQGENDPVQKIKESAPFGKSVFMRDVTEHGVVVQTTMVSRNALMLAGWGVNELELWHWFRGRDRCEQDHRATVQAEEEAKRRREQALEQQLKKYR